MEDFVGQCGLILVSHLISAIVTVESGGDPFAVHHNGDQYFFLDANAATEYAKPIVEAGGNIDLGLGQINSANLKSLNLSVESAFEPCANLQAAQTVFLRGYNLPEDAALSNDEKLMAAISRYNTGNAMSGVLNGYVGRVLTAQEKHHSTTNPSPVPVDLASQGFVPDGYSQTVQESE